MKKHIPNLLTLSNLFCGILATIFAVKQDFTLVVVCVVLGIIFDFFDGFVARLLKIQGELGKQLDSLADMVTSGVAPGIVMLQMFHKSLEVQQVQNEIILTYFPYVGLLLTLGACYRLANFNIDTRQSDSFIGLPTPAMCLFIVVLPLIAENSIIMILQSWMYSLPVLLIITILLTYLMNAELPLFALKFKDFSLKKNVVKYAFLVSSVVLIVSLKFTAIPIIILIYILISIVQNSARKIKDV